MRPLRIFIGFDEREAVAYHVLCESIRRHASKPVSITPLVRSQLAPFFSRARGPLESTDFAYTRFLVPFLVNYTGVAVFLDCDMLVRADIWELVHDFAGDDKAVSVCKHDYVPKSVTKFLGQQQTVYPRKNWSSVMLFNAALCQALTPDYVNKAPGSDLHRFHWLTDGAIGSLPLEWNWLVGEYPHNDQAKNLHYTLGGPWFPETGNCDHAADWFEAWQQSMFIDSRPA